MYYAKNIVDRLAETKSIVIYGASIVANEVANCLMGAPYNYKISSFIVSNPERNPATLAGIPVMSVAEGKKKHRESTVLVAVLEKHLDEIMAILKENDFTDIIKLTFDSDLWSEIRGNYFIELLKKNNEVYFTLEEELKKIRLYDGTFNTGDCVRIYMAKSHMDKILLSPNHQYGWEVPIQVGKDLTDRSICDVHDNMGVNISHKNKQYCELTALYWIWKNDVTAKYVGLCHYRRHFVLNKDILIQIEKSDIDVVLTIPILNFPNVREIYKNDHDFKDWVIMMEGIRKISPEYMDTARSIESGQYYYGYNMIIAKKKVFDQYCKWLFKILNYCEEHCEEKIVAYQNRYIGFLAERLLTIYFVHHKKILKIVHSRKEYLA